VSHKIILEKLLAINSTATQSKLTFDAPQAYKTSNIQGDCAFTCSPFRDLNGVAYHNHWLKNLLIASSLNSRGMGDFHQHKLI
jgi:hypothetical protein